jgi:TonB family protein
LDRLSAGAAPLTLSDINSSLGTEEMPDPAAAPELAPASAPPLSLAQEVAGTMNPARQDFTYDEKAPPPPAQTLWQWDPAFAARLPKEVPQLPSPVSDTDVSPSELQVALAPDGTVEHALLENSSQNPELDQQAILAVRRLRFRPVEGQGLTWGQVTVFWHATAPPAEVVVPTPPSSQ